MKYIRTKNRIYMAYVKLGYLDICSKDKHIKVCKVGDCKTYDTIEELCDQFVMLAKGKPPVVIGNNTFNEIKEMLSIDYAIIYGAIWTDKGLIYVAKMNDKGELELL